MVRVPPELGEVVVLEAEEDQELGSLNSRAVCHPGGLPSQN